MSETCKHGVRQLVIECPQCMVEDLNLGIMSWESVRRHEIEHLGKDGIEASVCIDIFERQQKGIAKYGVTVAENPLPLRQWLQHAYEECLDQAIYLKRAIAELEKPSTEGEL